jgi:hypothetical protein
MTHALQHHRSVALAAAGALLFAASLAAGTASADQVRQAGATAVVYRGPQVHVAISYRYPALNPGGTWLMLDTTMAATAAPLEISRSAISLRTPDGEIVPLASPAQYADAYPRLAWSIVKDDATREPLGLAVARPVLPLRYFPPRGVGLSFDAEWLDYWHNRYGRLFFEVPDGVQTGRYELLMNLPESKVVIPFTL